MYHSHLPGELLITSAEQWTYQCARFNAGEGQEENAIVTSTGQFVVAWDFRKIKRNDFDSYVIKKCV